MNEMHSFLRTIAENPEDDNPRLVFSDWLEENGHQDRAEFIRLQIELAKMDPSEDGYAEKTARMRRCGVFTDKPTMPYFDHLPNTNCQIGFRRGFMEAINTRRPDDYYGLVNDKDIDTSGFEFVPLQFLQTRGELINHFKQFGKLKRLNYNDWNATPAKLLEMFGPGGWFNNLEELYLSEVSKTCLEAGVIPKFKLPKLRNFYLHTYPFYELGFPTPSDNEQEDTLEVSWTGWPEYLPGNALPNRKTPLERFIWHADDDVDYYGDGDLFWPGPSMETLLEHLKPFKVKQVEVLANLDDHEGGTEGYMAAPYNQNPLELSSTLEHVTLDRHGPQLLAGSTRKPKGLRIYEFMGFDEPFFEFFSQPVCSELESLFVEDRCDWGNPEAIHCPNLSFANLKTLYLPMHPLAGLSNCQFPNLISLLGYQSYEAVMERKWPKLQNLELSVNNLKNLKAFAKSDCCPNLTTLSVGGGQFHSPPKPADLAFLAKCPHMPNLSLIRMFGSYIVKNGKLLRVRSDLMWDDRSVFDIPKCSMDGF